MDVRDGFTTIMFKITIVEQRMGTSQVTGTINSIIRYAKIISEIEAWLKTAED